MINLIKIIAERDYGLASSSDNKVADVRVMYAPPEIASKISDWYRANGWTITKEEI